MPARPRPVWPDCVPTLVDTVTGVTLRAHCDDDLSAIVEQSVDTESVRWTTVPAPYALDDARSFVHEHIASSWRTDTMASWAIEAEIDGVRRFCGTIDIRYPDSVRGEIGFGLHPAARGRGIMAAAGRLALDWAFDVKGLGVVRWAAHVGNWGSRHTAAALGFREQGISRAHMQHRGTLVDCWVASLLPSDPRTSIAAPRQPELPGARVHLRPIRDEDTPRIVEACADPRSARWVPGLPQPYTESHAQTFVDWCREGAFTGTQWTWAVVDADDRCLGAVTLFRLRDDAQPGEIGYWAHPDARSRGLISEAVGRVGTYALTEGSHQSLVIRCAADNAASRQVARAAEFVETGVLPRGERLRDGTYADLVMHARLR